MDTQQQLERRLNDFDAAERRASLGRLAAGWGRAARPEAGNVNLHCHSFFSYNADGFSPSRIAWEARKAGLYAAGLCDFDVLDGLDEFLDAGLALGLRATANLETRVFLREYAEVDINSPGEPGVTYIMGAGFARRPREGTPQAGGLAEYRRRARERNEALVSRINARLPEMAIDYGRDVLPLTPAGAATERHIVRAYVHRARAAAGTEEAAAGFWSRVLGRDPAEVRALLADEPAMEERVRSKLVKRGGLGYEQPSAETFPPADAFIAWAASCEAIPMITWLDGTSRGEKDGRAMLECMAAKGCAAINIIPDRNWNLKDPADRAVKVANLDAIVNAADGMGLPINIGTEMNRHGLPFVDDLGVEALRRHREAFLRGARIMVGHTLLLRYAGYGYTGPAALAEFPAVAARNAFFEAAGGLPPMDRDRARELEDGGSGRALAWFREAVRGR